MALLFILLQLAGLSNVAHTNTLTREANQAFAQGNYKQAARAYSDMVTKYDVQDEAVMTNLAHSYFRAGDVVSATRYYTVLANTSKDATLKSMANTQLGVTSARQNNYPEARERFKEALRQDPNNTLARLNYERLMKSKPHLQPPPPKKSEEEKKKEQQKQQQQGGTNTKPGEENKPQQGKEKEEQEKKRQQEQRKQDQEKKQGGSKEEQEKNGPKSKSGQADENDDGKKPGDKKDDSKAEEDEKGQAATREQLKKMQLSEEKSKQILDAMRASEIQYLQQKRFRRKDADRGKNDW